ncbi:PREDICTED: probable LRR receptor-like serine/threonine-protein kinase At1g07650 [Prunus mume]|uniref:non-specific serine/threonine protein kinase n=1 Tax=Prunus mume TaxID=102107 RepID=A0ABM1LL89_PRUMU|nr:PREDICTED: probable LRR receptor-like serine/threonine-protein kinase At1g07650 [Prunus mume]
MVRILNVPMDMIFLFSQINIVLMVLMCNMGPISSTAQPQNMTLPHDEVEALREIAAQLHKKDWNFSDPCSNVPTFSTPHTDQYNNTLFCNCSFPGNVCHIQSINLGQNYLSGSILHEWTSTKLKFLVLSVNNLSGPIPSYLGNIVTLQALYAFTGELPVSLTNMTKLKTLWIGSNNFTGKIPNYFLSWKELEMLEMQGSGLEGPIPPSLSALTKMSYLAISDLSGESSDFPNLSNMKDMQTLMIASNIEIVAKNFKFACSIIDLSYNNFSENSVPTTCQDNFNVFKSFSRQNNSILSHCLNPCSKEQYSVHINCGGKQATIGSIKYDGDEASGGGAKFFHDTGNWGFSSTGDFGLMNYDQEYIARNSSILNMTNSELYSTARISPLSLTYYARCLANGNYTVKLHFAEIVIRNNRSYYGVGRRIFDVYIQEKLVLKDFNIQKEAQGVDKEMIKVFKAVVNVMTLEIRFHWAGKGTTNAPKRGIYGSLISAISVESDFEPPDDSKKKIFIVVGAVSVLCLIFMTIGILWLRCCFGGRASTREQDLRGLDLQTGFFRFKQIKAATNNFDAANKLGEGGFGAVYKGELLDGTIIAVKQLSSKSKQGNREFVNEIGMISALKHPNLVRLYGCCIEGNQLLLVYEYMENNSLAHSLFGQEKGILKLDWPTRQKICVGIARGLAFMHEESTLKIVHRDIKTTNILLDRDLNPKISDFGLAKLNEEEKSHISTRVAGTIGYMAPEYALWGHLTDKVDVYGFGVVALELVSGKNNIKYQPNENYVCLLDWAFVLQQKGNLMELVDPKLGSEFNKEEAMRMIKVALLCTNPSPALRPTMSAVVSMLEGRAIVHELNINPSIYCDEMRFKSLRDESNLSVQQSWCETQSLIYLSDARGTTSSSSSVQDLYTINFDSQ